MDPKTLSKYAKLNDKINALEEERNALKADIMSDMHKQKVEKAETEYGTFTRATRTTWQYTKKVDKLSEQLKIAQIKEQDSGKAKAKVSEHLRFTPVIQ